MSWGLHIAADAQADLRRLDLPVQEHVLDELDRLTAHRDQLPPPIPGWGIVHAFASNASGNLSVLTLVLTRDDERQLLTLLGIYSTSL